MSTFIGQLVGFGLIVFLVVRYVVPPVRRLMVARQDTVRHQLDDSAAAAIRLTESTTAHTKAIEAAAAESQQVIEEAQIDATRITEQLQAQAGAEAQRIKAQADRQVELLRSQLTRQLRLELGHESVRGARELVRNHVSDAARRAVTVDRFLGELDVMAPGAAEVHNPLAATMRSASRQALLTMSEQFRAQAANLDGAGLSTLSAELVSVAKILVREPVLTRHLTAPSEDAGPRTRLIERLVTGQVGEATLDVLRSAVSQRWSTGSDLIDAIEYVSQQALLEVAERDNTVDEVEDQLFRFSRILDAQPRLAILLGDDSAGAAGRIGLLRAVLDGAGGHVNPIAVTLLGQTVELLRGAPAEESMKNLAEAAVARRGEIVAQVSAAADLTDAQRARLTEVLGRIYGHPVSLQLHIDPDVLGGLLISVADEVIDGTLSSRLAAAEAQLPD